MSTPMDQSRLAAVTQLREIRAKEASAAAIRRYTSNSTPPARNRFPITQPGRHEDHPLTPDQRRLLALFRDRDRAQELVEIHEKKKSPALFLDAWNRRNHVDGLIAAGLAPTWDRMLGRDVGDFGRRKSC